jgi:hypothetical protein
MPGFAKMLVAHAVGCAIAEAVALACGRMSSMLEG